MSASWSEADITRTRRTRSGHHCGSSSFGKLFMPLGTAVFTAVKSLLSEPGLGATTLTPTTRTAAITMRTMDGVWRMPNLQLVHPALRARGGRHGELIAHSVKIRSKERRAINLHAHQLCAGTWSAPPFELRNSPTKAAISSKPVGSRISKSELAENESRRVRNHLAST